MGSRPAMPRHAPARHAPPHPVLTHPALPSPVPLAPPMPLLAVTSLRVLRVSCWARAPLRSGLYGPSHLEADRAADDA